MFFKVTSVKTLSKCLLITIFSVLLLISALYLFRQNVKSEELPKNAETREQREAFIRKLGLDIDKAMLEEKKTVEIPYKFSDVYEEYNSLQKKAGYDLSSFGGKKVDLYTVKLLDKNRDDLYVNLLVLNGSIIGGDISAIAFRDGYMLPLKQMA